MTLAEYRKDKGEPIEGTHADSAHAVHHPSAAEYIQIGLILTVITAVEVGLYYIDMTRGLLIGLLIVLSMVKFTLVVLWFMHLKFDNRLFSYLFATGLFGTLVLFTIVLVMTHAQFVVI